MSVPTGGSSDSVRAALVLVAVAAAAEPAMASCPSPSGINTAGEWVISNPAWGNTYYNFGSPAVSPSATAVYWALTGGDPTLGAGADNGSYAVTLHVAPNYASYEGVDDYFFPRVINDGNPMNWQAGPADGCIDTTGSHPTAPDDEQCTCILLSDTWGNQGYYAVVSGFRDPFNNYQVQTRDSDLTVGSDGQPFNDIILSPVPPLGIVASARDGSDLLLTVRPAPSSPLDDADPCGCFVGYRVYGISQPRGLPAPVSRDISVWSLSTGANGPQSVTSLDATITVRLPCGTFPNLLDHYLVTVLEFDSGYQTRFTSANSTRALCEQILAEPNRPPRRPVGEDPGRPGRGKPAVR